MFSKNKTTGKGDKAPSPPSILGEDLAIQGNLASEGDIQIDGKVEGDIASKTLTIGEKAVVKGNITCETVFVAGAVYGAINARTVELSDTATVVGDIHHESLAIEAGATVDGFCRHISRRDASASTRTENDAEPKISRPSLVVGGASDE
ncbi:MAG: polymer-forming cytoskeletal protein [Alphaproteobacteria bacterium]|nr:polymer-forming cytoskeletal protein [Alphaproteobacteria bacterium]